MLITTRLACCCVWYTQELHRLIMICKNALCRSQWPRGLRRSSTAARLLRSWVRIPPGAWMFVCCECCVLSGRGLYDELITHPKESYRLWCVVVCDLDTTKNPRQWGGSQGPLGGYRAKRERKKALCICCLRYLPVYGSRESRNISKTSYNCVCRDHKYEGWNFNSGNYLFTTDTK